MRRDQVQTQGRGHDELQGVVVDHLGDERALAVLDVLELFRQFVALLPQVLAFVDQSVQPLGPGVQEAACAGLRHGRAGSIGQHLQQSLIGGVETAGSVGSEHGQCAGDPTAQADGGRQMVGHRHLREREDRRDGGSSARRVTLAAARQRGHRGLIDVPHGPHAGRIRPVPGRPARHRCLIVGGLPIDGGAPGIQWSHDVVVAAVALGVQDDHVRGATEGSGDQSGDAMQQLLGPSAGGHGRAHLSEDQHPIGGGLRHRPLLQSSHVDARRDIHVPGTGRATVRGGSVRLDDRLQVSRLPGAAVQDAVGDDAVSRTELGHPRFPGHSGGRPSDR